MKFHIETREDTKGLVNSFYCETESGEPEFVSEVARIAKVRVGEPEWNTVTVTLMLHDIEYARAVIS